MNEIELIKEQLKKMKDLKLNSNPNVVEHLSEIKRKYQINEDIDSPRDINRINVAQSIEDEIEDDTEEGDFSNEFKKTYRISGGLLSINSNTNRGVELTTEDKKAFQETMDEFVSEVSDLVNFDQLNVYDNNVDWGGKVVDFDTDFYFTIGENNGIYITNEMTKVDDNYLDFLNKLQVYYEKFKSKWAKVIAERKKTKPESPEQQ
jgi:hypothetical protein